MDTHTHPMKVAIEVPVLRDAPRQDTQVRQPVPSPLAAPENGHDHVVICCHKGLRVVDCIKGALGGYGIVGLAKRGAKTNVYRVKARQKRVRVSDTATYYCSLLQGCGSWRARTCAPYEEYDSFLNRCND